MNGVLSKNLPGLYTLGAYDIFDKLNQVIKFYNYLALILSFISASIILRNILYETL